MSINQKRIPAKVRRLVIERAHQCCEYCVSQEKFATQSFSIEHIDPRSQGGNNLPDNLAFACQGCNGHKFTKTKAIDPLTKQTSALYNPRKDSWHEHFCWNEDYTLILGITATGRATIETLKINRSSVLNLRQALYALGSHPPLHHRTHTR
jgi:hypothetical protein